MEALGSCEQLTDAVNLWCGIIVYLVYRCFAALVLAMWRQEWVVPEQHVYGNGPVLFMIWPSFNQSVHTSNRS